MLSEKKPEPSWIATYSTTYCPSSAACSSIQKQQVGFFLTIFFFLSSSHFISPASTHKRTLLTQNLISLNWRSSSRGWRQVRSHTHTNRPNSCLVFFFSYFLATKIRTVKSHKQKMVRIYLIVPIFTPRNHLRSYSRWHGQK